MTANARVKVVGVSGLPDGNLRSEVIEIDGQPRVHRVTLEEVHDVSPYPHEAKLRLADRLERIAKALRE